MMKRGIAASAFAGLLVPLAALGSPALPKPDAKCLARYDALGLPEETSDEADSHQVQLCRLGYAVSFNLDTRNPDWAIEHLTAANFNGSASRKNASFKEDPDLKKVQPGLSSVDADYKGQTTYQRGHQAPNADFVYSQAATNESFYFTNMSPQLGSLNGGVWGQLEKKVRAWITCGGRPELYVITGPVYGDASLRLPAPKQNDQVKTAADTHRVLVPKKYFKIVYDPDDNQAVALEIPNESVKGRKLEEFVVPISTIEADTGLTFLSGTGARTEHEKEAVTGTLWGHDQCR
jgi:endonuclease G